MSLDVLDSHAAANVALGRLDVDLTEEVHGSRLTIRILERIVPVHPQILTGFNRISRRIHSGL